MGADEYFAKRDDLSVDDIETGLVLAPKFDDQGLLPVVTTSAESGEILMLAYMNAESLALTIKTREAHYWSRSRNKIWRKGETSGNVQKVVEIRTDCDQDAIWLKVTMGGHGASCHLGYKTCFFRSIKMDEQIDGANRLVIDEEDRLFDPHVVYGAPDDGETKS